MIFDTETSARQALDDIQGITWRPFGREDLASIADLYGVCDRHDQNPERTSLQHLQEFWDSPRSVPEQDTLVGRDGDGDVVATCWSGCNRAVTEKRSVLLGGVVHPRHRRKGIGTAAMRWQLAHGNAWDVATRRADFGPLVMNLAAPAGQTDVGDLALRHGLTAERYFFEMSRRLDPSPAVPAVEGAGVEGAGVEGVRLVDWDPARSDEVHRVLDESFRDHWGHVDSTTQMWTEKVASHAFRPAWTVLAVDDVTDRVVGAAWNVAWEQDWTEQGYMEGYTDQLGVLRSHRGRGIASALLSESMQRFAAAGMAAAGLGVDVANPSNALRLYEKLGYRRSSSVCVYQFTRA